ncbi:hypothetical protein [Nocardiopsis halophila]|uniref:hypothetical protein n=1 Tax=Nocardiopsis halophila TaxID=141692 RepID=UPI0003711E07|nr:hypothetical protein [Nocardiopsis halophila]
MLVLAGGAAGVWFFTDIPFRMGIPGAVPRSGGTSEGPRTVPDWAVPSMWNSGDYTFESLEASTAAGLRTPGEVRESPEGDFTLDVLAVEPLPIGSSAIGPGMYSSHPELDAGFQAYAVTLKVINTTDQDLDLIYMGDKAGAGALMSDIPLLTAASDSWPTRLGPNEGIEVRRTYAVPTEYDYDFAVLEVRDPGTGPDVDDYRNDEQYPDFFSYWRLDLDPGAVTGPLADEAPGATADEAGTLEDLTEDTSVWRAGSPGGRMLPLHGTPLSMGVGDNLFSDNDATTDDVDGQWFEYKVENPFQGAGSWDFTEPDIRVLYGDDMKEAELYPPEEATSAPDRLPEEEDWDGAVGFEVPEGFEGPVLVEVAGPGTVGGSETLRYWFLEV